MENFELSNVANNYYNALQSLDFTEKSKAIKLFENNINISVEFRDNPSKYLLSQISEYFDIQEILENIDSVKYVEICEGLYCLRLPYDMLKKLNQKFGKNIDAPGVRGMAVNQKNGTNFMLLPSYENLEADDYESLVNLRHEASHILFFLLRKAEILEYPQSSVYDLIFEELIDEMIASVCGERKPHPYSRTLIAQKEVLEKDVVEKCFEIMDFTHNISNNKIKSKVDYSLIITEVMKLKNIDELYKYLKDLEAFLPEIVRIQKDWNSI
ncbi:MAG: hypothetical protein ABI721_01330 [Candidatus Dojkabacteria bacterium]